MWLNDEVVNYFFMLILAREHSEHSDKVAGSPKCHFLQTVFYTRLAMQPKGYSYADVRRWTQKVKVDIFTKDLVIVPIHLPGHWTLAVINFRMHRFEYFDSKGGSNGSVLANLQRWVQDEHNDKKGGTLFDTRDWPKVHSNMPQQGNGTDCGVFMTRTADYLARGATLDFTQSHMGFFRRRMVLEILRNSLTTPSPRA